MYMEARMTEEIPRGGKTIVLTMRLFTDNLSENRMAWNTGTITVAKNKARGIKSQRPVFFHDIEDLPKAAKKALKKNHIEILSKKKL
jgi:hypothetical protein